MGLTINTASFAMYTFSLAVLVQALTLVSFSALADYGKTPRKDPADGLADVYGRK
jgi:MFS-type transporter involved in bile tolerance (Atg22 family)